MSSEQREAASRYERTRESWVQHHQRQTSWSAGSFVRSFRIIKTRSAAHYSGAHPLLSLSLFLSSPPLIFSPSHFICHPHSYSCSCCRVALSFCLLSLFFLNKCLFLLSAVFFSPSLLRSFCVRFSLSLSFFSFARTFISFLPPALLR